ncbi:hypothetical protein ABZV64_08220 [Streptomyces sp. NPDC004959]|uniref:hypothetical protein n=1 Tax=Streptomyces sp. NPDC004959 TaxID=3154673 RepID=UPI0033A1AC89
MTDLALCHWEEAESGLLDVTVESFDGHFAVHARESWLMARGFGRWCRWFRGLHGSVRMVALASVPTAGHLPDAANK